jgi:hypothetical protein
MGLLYQPWMIDGDCGAVDGMNEWHWKTDVLGGNLLHCHSVHHKSHMAGWPDPGLRGYKPVTNGPSYCAVLRGAWFESDLGQR